MVSVSHTKGACVEKKSLTLAHHCRNQNHKDVLVPLKIFKFTLYFQTDLNDNPDFENGKNKINANLT